MTHSSRVRLALARLPEVDPAIAALSLWCGYRDGAGPTATQGDTIFVGPEFPLLPIPEQIGLIAHHILHVALRHSARRRETQVRFGEAFRPDRFDLACDALVNEVLLLAGHPLPRPAVRAAEIVELLPIENRPDNLLSDWDATRLYIAMLGQTPDRPAGDNDEIDDYIRRQGFKPDLEGSDPDTSEPDVWAGRIAQAMSIGRAAGTGVGAMITPLGDLPHAKVQWEIRLRRLLNKALSPYPRRSYRRPHRAWLARDALARATGDARPVFEPGLAREDRRPRLVIGIDTSSSIPDPLLAQFASEAIAIVRRTRAEAHLLGFDTKVHTTRFCHGVEDIKDLTFNRGGGTDFDDVLQEADKRDPSLIVILTDLDANAGHIPKSNVLWVAPGNPPATPAFGQLLVMD